MLAVADGRELGQAAAGREEGWRGVAKPERRQSPELGAEVERELDAARYDGVDGRDWLEVVLLEHRGGLLRKRPGESFDVLLSNREARRSPMPSPTSEQSGTGTERGVQVESRNGPA